MLDQAKNIFIVGIKGAAMANLAAILKKMGRNVSGSDLAEEFITDEQLKKNGISHIIGFKPESLNPNLDLVVYSAAHGGALNPQVVAAKKRDIVTLHQAEILGQLLSEFKTSLAVCGCHGKTTTSSLLAYSLINLGVKPSYMIGSSNFDSYPGGDYNRKDYFVIEADEYGLNPPQDLTPKFHYLHPNYILCTNVDLDHPDVYKSLEEVKQAYLKFFGDKKLILCADDKNTVQLINLLKGNQYSTFGYSETSDLRILKYSTDDKSSQFDLTYKNKPLGKFAVSLFGEKNISNAAGVILLLLKLGFATEKIKSAIKNFTGAKRRFELIYQKTPTYLFDDYAHHPKEIEATISAARKRFPAKRIVVVFQPHTYSRTEKFLAEFSRTLSLADQTFILPIFPSARENPAQFNISSQAIEKAAKTGNVKSVPDKKALLKLLGSDLRAGDVLLTMGAGDVYKLANDIIKIIESL